MVLKGGGYVAAAVEGRLLYPGLWSPKPGRSRCSAAGSVTEESLAAARRCAVGEGTVPEYVDSPLR